MNLAEFVDTWRTAITQRVIRTYKPIYHPNQERQPLPPLRRRPLGAQSHAIQGVILSIEKHRGTVLVGEMGTGKTFISIVAARASGMNRVLVICPPHLTIKWQREVRQTLPQAHAPIIRSIADLEALRDLPQDPPVYAIMSREKAKGSYRWTVATANPPLATPPVYRPGPDGHPVLTRGVQMTRDHEGQPVRVPRCPTCWRPVTNDDDSPIRASELQAKRTMCAGCHSALWQADGSSHRRYPLADYIKKRMKGFFDLLIADEVHEYKSRGSAQGIAAGVLAEACRRSLILTGTLMGGYASTLFHLLYRFSPAIRSEFERSHQHRWISRYGFYQHTRTYSDRGENDYTDGRSSRRRNYRTQPKELPGLTPGALFHLIGNTVFLRLADVSRDLPEYQEQILLTELSDQTDDTGFSQKTAYENIHNAMATAMRAAIVTGSHRLLSTYLQTVSTYPDNCTRGEKAIDPQTNRVIAEAPPLSPTRIYPKEQALIDLVGQERLQGRKVLVYVTHTDIRDVTGRMKEFLQRAGLRVAVMKTRSKNIQQDQKPPGVLPNTASAGTSDSAMDHSEHPGTPGATRPASITGHPPPEDRERWIQQRVAEGIDVLICSSRLVQTGLDLLDFPTIVWYETDYSVYAMRQASRRSWRIGQKQPVRVIFMAYQDTLQAGALRLVARKMQSSLAVEGDLPDEGLATFGDQGGDITMTLARRIFNQEEEDRDSIEALFSQARQQQEFDDEFLIDDPIDEWQDQPIPDPHPDTPDLRQPPALPTSRPSNTTLLNWKELLDQAPQSTRASRQRRATQSLFEWAIETSQEDPEANPEPQEVPA